MVKIDEEDGETIYLTRGDTTTGKFNRLAFNYEIKDLRTGEVELYEFQLTDKIAFIAMEKKGYSKKEIVRKEYTLEDLGYTEPATSVEIPLTEEDTKKFPLKNKRRTYWYDLVLNDITTMTGFNETGGKKMIVFPESGEIGE